MRPSIKFALGIAVALAAIVLICHNPGSEAATVCRSGAMRIGDAGIELCYGNVWSSVEGIQGPAGAAAQFPPCGPNVPVTVNDGGTGCVPTVAEASTAGTASALTADPADCTGDEWAVGIIASGAASCKQVGFGNLSGTVFLSQLADDSTAAKPLLSGGSGGNPAWATLTCSGTNKLTSASGVISCATDQTGAVTMTEAEIDFGDTQSWTGVFTITDASVSASSKILLSLAAKELTGDGGRSGDEYELDFLTCSPLPAAGTFTLYCEAYPGPVTGRFLVTYTVGS